MTDIELKFINLIGHEPIRYIVRKGVFVWYIEDLKGNKAGACFFKANADIKCAFYNAIYSSGYSRGVESSIKTMMMY